VNPRSPETPRIAQARGVASEGNGRPRIAEQRAIRRTAAIANRRMLTVSEPIRRVALSKASDDATQQPAVPKAAS